MTPKSTYEVFKRQIEERPQLFFKLYFDIQQNTTPDFFEEFKGLLSERFTVDYYEKDKSAPFVGEIDVNSELNTASLFNGHSMPALIKQDALQVDSEISFVDLIQKGNLICIGKIEFSNSTTNAASPEWINVIHKHLETFTVSLKQKYLLCILIEQKFQLFKTGYTSHKKRRLILWKQNTKTI